MFVVDDLSKMVYSGGFWRGDPFDGLWSDAVDGDGELRNGIRLFSYM